MRTAQFGNHGGPTVTAACCRACCGQDDPVIPVGAHVQAPVLVCGICRLALRDDDDGECMRIAPEDVEAIYGSPDAVQPGAYFSCEDCVRTFRPAIAKRLGKTTWETVGELLL